MAPHKVDEALQAAGRAHPVGREWCQEVMRPLWKRTPILHPIRSLKEALVHVGIVTIGIVIALSFEGVLEWFHNRALVAEARENLRNEMVNNQKDVQLVLKSLDTAKPRFIRAIDLLGTPSALDHSAEAASLFNPER